MGTPQAGLLSKSWFRYFTLDYMTKKAKKGSADVLLEPCRALQSSAT